MRMTRLFAQVDTTPHFSLVSLNRSNGLPVLPQLLSVVMLIFPSPLHVLPLWTIQLALLPLYAITMKLKGMNKSLTSLVVVTLLGVVGLLNNLISSPFLHASPPIESSPHRSAFLRREVRPDAKDFLTTGHPSDWKKMVTATVDSSTGTLFHGEVVRQFTGPRVSWSGIHALPNRAAETVSCDKWSVVTTIFDPTDAVRRAADLPGWCIVIVADTKTPQDYVEQAKFANEKAMIHYLSVEDQQEWADRMGLRVGDFVRSIPFRHFARKNIGYLYAIIHGAKFVFDFDDDNILTLDGDDKVFSPLANETHVPNVRIPVVAQRAFNHHPLMKSTAGNLSWARGFPLDRILDDSTWGDVPVELEALPMDKVAVLQYCADSNPDIDAIHRLTKPLPMDFDPSVKPVVVPSRTYSPYNAQATVHTAASLWATLLPATVPGRVSDIWRGYFAQRLFHDTDMSLVFLPPRIRQDRNIHSYLADMKAELDLYFKSAKLLEFLDDWQPDDSLDTIPARMEALWIDLYERSYIEVDDVTALQLWLQALVESGYEFPPIKRDRYTNVMLMGQFNFARPNRDVKYWVQKWREAFRHVQVRGPFAEDQVATLRDSGVDAYGSDEGPAAAKNHPYKDMDTAGFFSPMSNLGNALQQQATVPGMDGVIYIHDDAYANVNILGRDSARSATFPSDSILANQFNGLPKYEDAKAHPKVEAFRVLSNGDFSVADGTRSRDEHVVYKFHRANKGWWVHWNKCVLQLRNVVLDPKSKELLEDDGSLIVPDRAQSDFLFVPTRYADRFKAAADLMVQHGVYLECGMPTIVQTLRHLFSDLKVGYINLCTQLEEYNTLRGKAEILEECIAKDTKGTEKYGVYHPYKISKGLESWGSMFDRITFAETK